MRFSITLWTLLIFLLIEPSVILAQVPTAPLSSSPSTDISAYAPVKVDGRQLFDIMGIKNMTALERADKVNRRLNSLVMSTQQLPPFELKDLVSNNNETTITLDGNSILNVTNLDAQDALTARDSLAFKWGDQMANAVRDAQQVRSNALKGSGILIRNSISDMFVSAIRWLPRLGGAFFLTILFWLFAKFNGWIVKTIATRTRLDGNIGHAIRKIVYYGTWAVGILAIMSSLGLEGGSIATTLGVSGFVLGFAFKDILSHFFAGFMLLLGQQFHIGDQIVVNGFEGTVERIELRALYLRTYDNRLVIIPNGDVFTSVVTSNTASPFRRREFCVGIGYDDPIEKAQRIALETIITINGVSAEPSPDVLVDELAPSTVNLRIRFYTNSQRADYLRVGSECMIRVKEAFDREKISMPTNIQTLVIQNPSQVPGELANPVSEVTSTD
ncbi:MAG: mechanosensitive ion channel family protein [Chthonomonadales bacterium]